MLKKNQLALILLTLVMMLTVYYIKNPFGGDENPDPDDDGTDVVEGRLEQLAERRLIIKNSRKELIVELDGTLASDESTVEEKAVALEQKNFLNALTEKEILLELDIINNGYQDAFVHASTDGVNIIVVADDHSVSAANEIILKTLLELGNVSSEVHVQFQTVSQVMGTSIE